MADAIVVGAGISGLVSAWALKQAGLEPMLFGLIIVIFVIFEPDGINGRWKKLLHFFETYPYYRKASFVRQKSYLKTERMR